MERKDLELMIQKLHPQANKALLECANGPTLFFTLFCFKLIDTQSETIKLHTEFDVKGCYNTAINHKKSLGEKLAGILEEFPELTKYIMSNKYAFFLECGSILLETHIQNTLLNSEQKIILNSLDTNNDLKEELKNPNIKKRKK